MRPPAHTIEQLVRHIRLAYPDHDCSWPRIPKPNLEAQWEECEEAFMIALDDTIPWMQFYKSGKTILQQAYLNHVRGEHCSQFLTAGRLNEQARIIVRQMKADEEEARQAESRKLDEQERADPTSFPPEYLKWKAAMMARGMFRFDESNPFAPDTQEKYDDLCAWVSKMNQTKWKNYPVEMPQAMPSRSEMMGPKKRGGKPLRLASLLDQEDRLKTLIASQER